ncbi:MAG: tRNA preQ1(34) S-adenosylmethionine ribosyltransferase-isomerase QueA [Dehalococcoidia bacterium]|nr:tRNA preQ1(34) S-adenosylmethionine ribosyltransferase-isomerase QueA [Dehalococcoidia bacterium]
MRTSDFAYHLPPELIAQTPVEPRDSSRLLVLRRATGQLEHRQFTNLVEYLRPGDVMVFNQSRVIPARLHGRRKDTGGPVELLLLRREEPGIWLALGKPGRRLRPGACIVLEPAAGAPATVTSGGMEAEVLEASEDGTLKVRLSREELVDGLGQVPLPPYIHQPLADRERYQTVYARHAGSAAAPTAGLHFTLPLLRRLEEHGVLPVFVTLHVGLDTFRPVRGENPAEHKIHTEFYEVDAQAATALNRARQEGRRVIAVGTTSVRVLEQIGDDIFQAGQEGRSGVLPVQGQARLFILPGHQFRLVDAMITNFHLPRSTLLMLVSAFAGREVVLQTYQEAMARSYRFYSFGDAMLIL